MKVDDHEAFVELCVFNFDEINESSNGHRTPNSSHGTSKNKIVSEDAWRQIATTMNRSIHVLFRLF